MSEAHGLDKLSIIAKEYASACEQIRVKSELISSIWWDIEQKDSVFKLLGTFQDEYRTSFEPLQIIRANWISESREDGCHELWNGWHDAIEIFFNWEDHELKPLLLRLADLIGERKLIRLQRANLTRRLATIGRALKKKEESE